ncbi:protein PAXX [Strigops habroptila]|uniref:protein PAXX n=1 Tax=Strigops habroptila TaxID=2489341 RepID=UPI0011D03404|nr:protein PAXX [Strigops habroptila]
MAEAAGPFHRLQAGSLRGRERDWGRGRAEAEGPRRSLSRSLCSVTDALEVWTGELSARPSLGCRCQPEEHGAKLREALGRGAASLSPGERPGTLRLRGGAACSALELCPLPAAEARSQLRALLFGMAGHIESLERRLSAVVETLASSCSPEKSTTQSQQQFLPDPKPGKNRGAGSTLPARRKIPGESLINPGFKSKKAPSGVDFEDS